MNNALLPSLEAVERANRLVTLHRDRSVTIEDEWIAGQHPVDVAWQWLTGAAVTRTGDGLLLRQLGRSLELTITWAVDMAMDIEDVSRPEAVQDSPNPGPTRIVIRLRTAQNHKRRLSVRAEPGAGEGQKVYLQASLDTMAFRS